MIVRFTLNGRSASADIAPAARLVDVLRDVIGLTGTKVGCEEGECGACTVLMNGQPVQACIVPASMADQTTITTIEGLAKGDALHPVQEAFLAEGAMQCGYCTPGMILRTVALLEQKPNPSRKDIITALDGNICRCNGYLKIMSAIERAARMKGGMLS